jgi:hypothetical protein
LSGENRQRGTGQKKCRDEPSTKRVKSIMHVKF